MNSKYVFITGGIVPAGDISNITSSLACLLKARGLRVAIQSLAPYLNHDSGSLDSERYGECYVTEDGSEMPYQLGRYERFTGERTTKNSCITLGNVLQTVFNRERRGEYDGEKVTFSIHVVDEIERRICQLGKSGDYDVIISEISGSITDMATMAFIEAMRRIRYAEDKDTVCLHVARSGNLYSTVEPAKSLMASGLQTDELVMFTGGAALTEECVAELAREFNLRQDCVTQVPADTLNYELPELLYRQKTDCRVLSGLNVEFNEADLAPMYALLDSASNASENEVLDIAFIAGNGSWTSAEFESLQESIRFAALHRTQKVAFHPIERNSINADNAKQLLEEIDGIVFPHQTGESGEESNIAALRYCREKNIPTLGIGFGMRCMVKEFARNVMKINDGDIIEPAMTHLGADECKVRPDSRAAIAYGKAEIISERHRHNFEINKTYTQLMQQAGMVCSGENAQTRHAEIVELPELHWYIGTIFNPEYSSTISTPNPLIADFVSHTINYHNLKNQNG